MDAVGWESNFLSPLVQKDRRMTTILLEGWRGEKTFLPLRTCPGNITMENGMDKMDIWVVSSLALCVCVCVRDLGVASVWNFGNPFYILNRWPGINNRERPSCIVRRVDSPGSFSKMCFFIFPSSQRNQRLLGRVAFRRARVLFFTRDNIFRKFSVLELGRRWAEIFTKGQFILLTLIKSYVPSCTIFQLFEITFLLLFVFLRGFWGFWGLLL